MLPSMSAYSAKRIICQLIQMFTCYITRLIYQICCDEHGERDPQSFKNWESISVNSVIYIIKS